jgi:16S rRNA (guanine966-N2)-methyltransferase
MRIIAGSFRGRTLVSPPGQATRPTAQRMRQAVFDMLMHAPWGGRRMMDGASVLDAFAGTGALGLEAASRGAARVSFMENDRHALAALRANVTACKLGHNAVIVAADVLRPPPGTPHDLVFLDPPYARGLLPAAIAALSAASWIDAASLCVAEMERDETLDISGAVLAEKAHGVARVIVWRGVS